LFHTLVSLRRVESSDTRRLPARSPGTFWWSLDPAAKKRRHVETMAMGGTTEKRHRAVHGDCRYFAAAFRFARLPGALQSLGQTALLRNIFLLHCRLGRYARTNRKHHQDASGFHHRRCSVRFLPGLGGWFYRFLLPPLSRHGGSIRSASRV